MSTYRIDDKAESVARYQTYLDRVLGGVYRSGVFDERTRQATLKYQEKKGLPALGRVDFSTFNAVYRDYKAALLSDAYAATWHGASPLPFYEGYYGDDMIHLGGIISSLSARLLGGRRVRVGRRFSSDTADAVEALRRVFLLPEGRFIDFPLYDAMTREMASLKKFEII